MIPQARPENPLIEEQETDGEDWNNSPIYIAEKARKQKMLKERQVEK